MNNLIEEVQKRKDEILERTKHLLEIPSILDHFDEKGQYPFGENIFKALDYMLKMGKEDGFDVLNCDNYAGHIEFGTGDEILGILCHLDVVPVSDGWKYGPFNPTVSDHKLYARGSVDDKGPTMAAYYALKILKDLGFKPNKKIRLILGCDEETGMRGVKHYFKKEKMPELGFAPDADFPLIYGEKGHASFFVKGNMNDSKIKYFKAGDRFNVVPDKAVARVSENVYDKFLEFTNKTGNKGIYDNNEITFFGKSAHAMHPQVGKNAAFILLDFLNECFNDPFLDYMNKYITNDPFGKKLKIDTFDEEMKELTMNVGILDIEDGKFQFSVDIRFPKNSCEDVIRERFANSVKSYGYIFEDRPFTKVYYVPKNDFLVQNLLNSYRKYTNDFSEPITIGGGTYSKMMKKCVAFGPVMPGRTDLAHQTDEYIELDDLYLAIAIYADAIYNLSK